MKQFLFDRLTVRAAWSVVVVQSAMIVAIGILSVIAKPMAVTSHTAGHADVQVATTAKR